MRHRVASRSIVAAIAIITGAFAIFAWWTGDADRPIVERKACITP
jgi:hypothetical protein